MAAKGRQPPTHRRTGVALGVHGETEELTVQCVCGAVQTEIVDATAPIRQTLAGISCLWCGRVQMQRARAC